MIQEETPILLYKYLPPDEACLNILTQGTLKFTNPMDFNDPFDCLPRYKEIDISRFNKERSRLLREITKSKGLSPEKHFQQKNKGAIALQQSIDSGEFNERVLSGVGVLSLTSKRDDILMWSHYAGFHKGFAVELKLELDGELAPGTFRASDLNPLVVYYSDDRPIIDMIQERKKEEIMSLLTKSKHWEYEKEWRHIDADRGPGIHPYTVKKHLSGIIIGAKTDMKFERRILEAAKVSESRWGLKIKIMKAKINKEHYVLDIVEIEE